MDAEQINKRIHEWRGKSWCEVEEMLNEHTTLTARVEELEAENAKLLDEVEARRFTDERTDKLLNELEAENKRLREALGFYADRSKWRCSICVHEQEHVDGICLRDCFNEPLYGGDIAREALEGLK